MPLLEIDDLHVAMGPHEILHGVSLKAEQGAVVAVLGANGVGKTTLMRAVSGIYPVAKGVIRFDGHVISGLPSDRIVRLGLAQAPEGRQIFPNMTVRENLALGAYHQPKAAAKDTLAHVLELFPVLEERLTQRAGSLSGGEQQMLCIGRALMSRPKLLLLDEPSLGLAPMMVARIFELVRRIRDEGATILVVEQNAKAALCVADHAYVIEAGRIATEGPAGKLAQDPALAAAYLGGHACAG